MVRVLCLHVASTDATNPKCGGTARCRQLFVAKLKHSSAAARCPSAGTEVWRSGGRAADASVPTSSVQLGMERICELGLSMHRVCPILCHGLVV